MRHFLAFLIISFSCNLYAGTYNSVTLVSYDETSRTTGGSGRNSYPIIIAESIVIKQGNTYIKGGGSIHLYDDYTSVTLTNETTAVINDTSADTDFDGINDLDEFINGTDINVPDLPKAPEILNSPVQNEDGKPLLEHPAGGYFYDENEDGLYTDGTDTVVTETEFSGIQSLVNSKTTSEDPKQVTFIAGENGGYFNIDGQNYDVNGDNIVFFTDINNNGTIDDGELSFNSNGGIPLTIENLINDNDTYTGSGDLYHPNGSSAGSLGETGLTISGSPAGGGSGDPTTPDDSGSNDSPDTNDPEPETETENEDSEESSDNDDTDSDPTADPDLKIKLDDINIELDNVTNNTNAINNNIQNNGVKLDDVNRELNNITNNTQAIAEQLEQLNNNQANQLEFDGTVIDDTGDIQGSNIVEDELTDTRKDQLKNILNPLSSIQSTSDLAPSLSLDLSNDYFDLPVSVSFDNLGEANSSFSTLRLWIKALIALVMTYVFIRSFFKLMVQA